MTSPLPLTPEERHTPGPWRWWTSNSWRQLARDDSRGGHFAWVLEPIKQNDGHPDCLVSEADMGLIAAAPDLLGAAIEVRARCQDYRLSPDASSAFDRLNAAIIKAQTPVSR